MLWSGVKLEQKITSWMSFNPEEERLQLAANADFCCSCRGSADGAVCLLQVIIDGIPTYCIAATGCVRVDKGQITVETLWNH